MSVSDRRRANMTWTVDRPDGTVDFAGAQLAVLMDIRDELQKLNAVFHCLNFLNVPAKLDRIARNTAKPRVAKKAAQ